jgi:hypothetical protein
VNTTIPPLILSDFDIISAAATTVVDALDYSRTTGITPEPAPFIKPNTLGTINLTSSYGNGDHVTTGSQAVGLATFGVSGTLPWSTRTAIATAGGITLTLPNIGSILTPNGMIIVVKNAVGIAGTTISPFGAEFIDGGGSIALAAGLDAVTLQCEKATLTWWLLSNYP